MGNSIKMRWLSAMCLVFLCCACSTTSRQIVGQKRPPVDVSQVQIYHTKPAEYEQIAFIQASSKHSLAFSDEAMREVIIERLKQEAAALGANGVLIEHSEELVSGSVGTATGMSGSHLGVGIGLSLPITNQLTHAVAIYVVSQSDENAPVAE